ncbi:uncharacterized protein K02A2.6-like [Aedes albopictus]|uniref:RNA-directed DNA polymerase n=1 Tax=Aedes albopictus TaxID=7160 RepID=A0ABM1YYK1_AEDAL
MTSQRRPDEDYVIAAVHVETEIRAILEDTLRNLPVTFNMIAAESQKDATLKQVSSFVQCGWPSNVSQLMDPAVKKFYARRDGLQLIDNCVMFGDRIIVPQRYRKQVLKQLHRGHPGMERMKAIARSYVYWPDVDGDVEQYVRQCRACADAAKSPRKTTLESWPIPTKPWSRIHIDYAGPIDGLYYLVIVDAFSKWPEIFRTRSITASSTIELLRETFARYGNPNTLVSDNGTQFTCESFKNFCCINGITHIRTAPYHPQSNGQAERFVDSLKRGLKKLNEGGRPSTPEHLQTFLSVYRSTPNKSSPQMKSPAEVFLGRPVRTTLDLLKKPIPVPAIPNEKQNIQCNKRHGATRREFQPDDMVFAEYHHGNQKSWKPGVIIERKGSVNYNVLLDLGRRQRLIQSHTNQLRPRADNDQPEASVPDVQLP